MFHVLALDLHTLHRNPKLRGFPPDDVTFEEMSVRLKKMFDRGTP